MPSQAPATISNNSLKRIQASERRWRMYEMVLQGASYREIATKEKTVPSIVKDGVDWCLDELAKLHAGPASERLRTLYTQRYELMFRVAFAKAITGDDEAFDRCLALLAHLRKLNGADIPERTVHEINARIVASMTKREATVIEAQMGTTERALELLPLMREAGILTDDVLDALRAMAGPQSKNGYELALPPSLGSNHNGSDSSG